ncbi:Inosine 5'-monophosphate dehydrogenase [Candidatus Nitrosocosmicus franklandus]|uniref:Inosine 5'-monophosphate dehydrogenase n=2 Tax=Candidatus Nitrosocosmicus franklandianus TaxID=1798806 RepID=A0A484IEM8_9ARCH|nr:Inosine 5'-monophosphate dehydrogenase [Candidatus Nitrosocosmicus franklandus]
MYLYFEGIIHNYQMPFQRTTKIRDIMTRKLETIGSTASAHEVAIKMRDKKVSSVLVMDERYGIPLGIVTERDLARKVCVTDKNSTQLLASKVMSFPLIKVNSEVSALEAADLMLKNKVRHLLVVSTESQQEKRENGINEDKDLLKPVGIITPMDFIRYKLVISSGYLSKDSHEDNDTKRILEYYKNDANFD